MPGQLFVRFRFFEYPKEELCLHHARGNQCGLLVQHITPQALQHVVGLVAADPGRDRRRLDVIGLQSAHDQTDVADGTLPASLGDRVAHEGDRIAVLDRRRLRQGRGGQRCRQSSRHQPGAGVGQVSQGCRISHDRRDVHKLWIQEPAPAFNHAFAAERMPGN